jgi:chromosome segregation ATPase
VAEVPQQQGPCTGLLSRSSSSTQLGLEAASMAQPDRRSSSNSSTGSIDMFYSLRTVAGATTSQEGCCSLSEQTAHSNASETAEQWLQRRQLLQQLSELAGSISCTEALSAAVQQHCSSLSIENSQLRSQEALARAQARQLAVRHDACLSKLMQAQQQLEQQRLQLKASQSFASQRLQQLLQLVQAKQQQAAVCSTISEDPGSREAQQQQQQQHEEDQQLPDMECTQQADAGVQLQQSTEQQQLELAAVAELQQQQQQPEPVSEQVDDADLSCGVDWLWKLVSELESSTLQVIDSREQDMAPLQQLQQQVQELRCELQQVTKAAEATAAEKQQLLRARDGLSLKLAECQRQLLQKHSDLTAVTNDRIAIAAGKTKLHHQLQEMQVQQQELELAGQQALEAAELNAQRADQLQQQLSDLRGALSSAELAKQKSDQELKLAQSECENGLHQVAQLQLELQAAKVQHSKALQDLQQQLTSATNSRIELQEQLNAAQAARDEQESKVEEQVKQLQQQLLAAGVAEGSSRQQMLQLQQQLDAAAAEAKQLQQQLAAAQSVRDKSLQETQKLQQKLQAAAADKQLLQKQLSATQTECITAQQQLVHVHQEVAQLKQQLAAADAVAAEVQQQLQASQQEVKSLHDSADLENSQLVEALRAAQARIAGAWESGVGALADHTTCVFCATRMCVGVAHLAAHSLLCRLLQRCLYGSAMCCYDMRVPFKQAGDACPVGCPDALQAARSRSWRRSWTSHSWHRWAGCTHACMHACMASELHDRSSAVLHYKSCKAQLLLPVILNRMLCNMPLLR